MSDSPAATVPAPAAGSGLARLLAAGQAVVTAEVNPPRHAGGDAVRAEARALRNVVDAANLTDGTRGIVRMSSIAAAVILRDEGVEPIVQMTCRDRNRIALQSELLGLSAMGLHNVLLLSGDDPTQGDHPDAKPVFDLNGTSLLAAATGLTEGRMLSGREFSPAPTLFLGAAGDPEADLAKPDQMAVVAKAEAGARFIQTQMAFDLDRFAQWMGRIRDAGLIEQLAVIAGVFIVDSAQRAEFLRTKVYGVVMPDATFDRMAKASDEKAEGLLLAAELVDGLMAIEGVRGVHLMGINATDDMAAVVEGSSLARRAGGG